jgi:hypothetical protein
MTESEGGPQRPALLRRGRCATRLGLGFKRLYSLDGSVVYRMGKAPGMGAARQAEQGLNLYVLLAAFIAGVRPLHC